MEAMRTKLKMMRTVVKRRKAQAKGLEAKCDQKMDALKDI